MRSQSTAPNGVVLYRGPSRLDGSPIVVILTGIKKRSANAKTGDMLQTWIIRSDVSPYSAIHSGDDASVCGACPLRGYLEETPNSEFATRNRFRGCYVNIAQAPRAIFVAYQNGRYPDYAESRHADLLRGRFIRFGSYGDPCAAPWKVWRNLASLADGHTGYSHQWRDRKFAAYRRFIMASCETTADVALAHSKGWRTFRTRTDESDRLLKTEITCPASLEAGHRKTCAECRACDGVGNSADRVSIAIIAHGSPATLGGFRHSTLEVN